ncbi:hypothetical protein [Bacillus marasmi]|uniref:hypothetical protein n=1 Tax=Bacillus marasmi TaxID=1926279 RepID=UPI0011CA7085|nr:hypothetical protein [Bacillus marasmi]
MKYWNYTNISKIVADITEDGLPSFEKKLQGWNDTVDQADIVDIVVIKAIVANNGTEIDLKLSYCSEEVMNDLEIKKKSFEMEQTLLKEVQLWINGND